MGIWFDGGVVLVGYCLDREMSIVGSCPGAWVVAPVGSCPFEWVVAPVGSCPGAWVHG